MADVFHFEPPFLKKKYTYDPNKKKIYVYNKILHICKILISSMLH